MVEDGAVEVEVEVEASLSEGVERIEGACEGIFPW